MFGHQRAVGGEYGGHADAHGLPVLHKFPFVQAVRRIKRGHNAAALRQVLRAVRCAVSTEKFGRGNEHHRAFGGHGQHHHVLCDIVYWAHAEIKAFGHGVGHLVVDKDFNGNVGIAAQEIADFRIDEIMGGVFGGVDAQLAGETVLKVAQRVGFAADAVKQRRGTLEKLLSRFGGRHGVGGTVQQLHAQPRFQCADAVAQGGGLYVQRFRCAAEVACLHHLDKGV